MHKKVCLIIIYYVGKKLLREAHKNLYMYMRRVCESMSACMHTQTHSLRGALKRIHSPIVYILRLSGLISTHSRTWPIYDDIYM